MVMTDIPKGRHVKVVRCPFDNNKYIKKDGHSGRTGVIIEQYSEQGPWNVQLDKPADDGGLDYCMADEIERIDS